MIYFCNHTRKNL